MYKSRVSSACESIFSFHKEPNQTSSWACPLQGPPVLYLAASNDGFLCFWGHWDSKPAIFVCNPMIPGVWAILTIEIERQESRDCLIGLGFDRKLGSGKIVLCGKLYHAEQRTTTLVYNAKNNTWRKVSDIDDTFVSCMNDPFVFGGLFCWIVKSKRRGKQMVMLFSVENEAWEQPILLDERCFRPLCMLEFEKQLCFICQENVDKSSFHLWKLDMDTRSATWVKSVKHTMPRGLPFVRYVFGGEDIFYVGYQNELWACNVNNGKWWHRTVVFRPIIFRRPQRESRSRLLVPEREYISRVFQIFKRHELEIERESISRLFKPSLFRFDGGGQLWDSYQCGIDDPMSNYV
jgi:F-box interacting protein